LELEIAYDLLSMLWLILVHLSFSFCYPFTM
jgi:hypothetical protein